MTDEVLLLGAIWLGLTLYALFGGADFGAGVWEVWTAFRTPRAERRLLREAIAPVWEANHVWLIFVLVVLWTAFPPAFSSLLQFLWTPLLLALLGIVFRGAGFAFRTFARQSGPSRESTPWAVAFAIGSMLAPVALGAAAGAVAAWPPGIEGPSAVGTAAPWLRPTSVFTAILALGASAHVAAVFLVRDAEIAGEPDLARMWRRRAFASGVAMGVLAAAGLAFLAADAPLLWDGFRERGLPFVVGSVACGALSLVLLRRGPAWGAVLAASAAVCAIIVGWGAAQFLPGTRPADFLLRSAAPPNVLRALIVSLAIGAAIVAPSLVFLYRVFKRRA